MQPKVTIEQMAEIFELRSRGVFWDNISTLYGVSKNTLSRYARLAEEYGFGFWYGEYQYVKDHQPSRLELENAVLKQTLDKQTDTFRELFDELLDRIVSVEKSLDDLRTICHENNHTRKPTRN